jgi:hypothetical protein
MTYPTHRSRSECPDCGRPLYEDAIHTCTPRAFVLADALDNPPGAPLFIDAAVELRRLQKELDICRTYARGQAELVERMNRTPLNQRQIDGIWQRYMHGKLSSFTDIVRAVESAHGIAHKYTNDTPEGSET